MLSFSEDNWLRERWLDTPRWVVTLSDGATVYQDDDRPGEPTSAWLRLKAYLQETGIRIVSMRLSFRDHVERPVPDNAAGYFFSKSVIAFLGGGNLNFYMVGHVTNNGVAVQRWKVPELIWIESELRPIDTAGEGLIC